MRFFISLMSYAACLFLLVQCGGHQPGDPPRGDALPQFLGAFLWDGKLAQMQPGETVWRGEQMPPLDGIVLYDSTLASSGLRPEEAIALYSATPVRKEIKYFLTPDGEQLSRVEVRPAPGFLDKGNRLALKIMPLEKPGAVMAVPVAPLDIGLYVLDFMGKKHRFAIGMGSAQETSLLAAKMRDRVLKTKRSSNGMFGNSPAVTVEDSLRDPAETDKEEAITGKLALESWEKKNYAEAITTAVIAVGYHPDDNRLREIAMRGRLTAAQEALEAKNYADAERWAEQASLHDPGQAREAQIIIHEAKLLPHLARAADEIKMKNFAAAHEALGQVSIEGRKDPRFGEMESDLNRTETAHLIQKTMDAKQWDEALDLVNKAVDNSIFNIGPANGWIARIRKGAAEDRRYFGRLHQPVWDIKLGEGEMRMHSMRKTPGADLLIVCLSRGQLDEQASFAALKASTGEVEWMAPMPEGGLACWSEDGRYVVMGDSSSGFQSPEHCYVVDLKERKRLPATQRPWPARHSVPVAIHGGSGLFAVAVRSRDLVVELIDLSTGKVRQRIAPQGIRGESSSGYDQDMSFVRTMCFSLDGQKLLTFSEDQTLRIFDVASGNQIGNGVEHRDDSLNEFRHGSFNLNNDGQRVLHQISGLLAQSVFRTMGAGSRRENLSTVLTLHPDFSLFLGSAGMLASKTTEVFSLSPEGSQQRIGELQAPFGIQCAAFDDKDPVIYVAGGGGHVLRLAVTPPKEGDDAFSPETSLDSPSITPALAERLISFVTTHHARSDQRDVNGLMADYADSVDYHNFGMVQPARLRELLQDGFGNTGKRRTMVKHQPEPRPLQNGCISLEYPILLQEEGKADQEMTLSLEVRAQGARDEIKIVREKSIIRQ